MPPLLEDLPLAVLRQAMYFMHDGAPAHFSHIVREHLNECFPNRWVGKGGPTPWLPRSPDLNPLDFFLWGHLKSLVYSTDVEDEATLHARIMQGCQTIRITLGIFLARSCLNATRSRSLHFGRGWTFRTPLVRY